MTIQGQVLTTDSIDFKTARFISWLKGFVTGILFTIFLGLLGIAWWSVK